MTEFLSACSKHCNGLRSGTHIEQTSHSEQHSQKALALSTIDGDE